MYNNSSNIFEPENKQRVRADDDEHDSLKDALSNTSEAYCQLPVFFTKDSTKALLSSSDGRNKLAYAWAHMPEEYYPEAGFADAQDENNIIVCCPADNSDMSKKDFNKLSHKYNGAISCHAILNDEGTAQISLYISTVGDMEKAVEKGRILDSITFISLGDISIEDIDDFLDELDGKISEM